jgi:Helix-turn-helix domain
MTNEVKQYLTAKEVAEVLRLKPNSIYLGSLRHDLPWVKLRRGLRLAVDDFNAYLQRHTEKPGEAA